MNRGLLLATLMATSPACGGETGTVHSRDEDPITRRDSGSTKPSVRDAGRDAGRDARAAAAGDDDDDDDDNSAPSKPIKPTVTDGPEVCESIDISTGSVAPDVLIVLDRSSSMKTDMVNRWDPSVSGLTNVTAKLQSQIRFGLMAFPGGGAAMEGGGRGCAAGTLDVPIDIDNAAPIATMLQNYQLVGTTPTASTLEAAHKVLKTRKPPADMGALGAPYIVLVTDGAPNCSDDDRNGLFGGGGPADFDQMAFEASVAAIKSMAKDGIKTFVLGYDANDNAQLKMSLDAMAVAGDTGDTEHHEIENEVELVEAFTAIAGKAVSCDFTLSAAPNDPSYVLVKVGGEQLNYGDPNGWILSDDKLTLTLQGDACGKLPKVAGSHVSVKVQCTVVPVL
jgi:hypothetical protein